MRTHFMRVTSAFLATATLWIPTVIAGHEPPKSPQAPAPGLSTAPVDTASPPRQTNQPGRHVAAQLLRTRGNVVVMRLDEAGLTHARTALGEFVIDRFPLSATRTVTLRLERFTPIVPDARFVISRAGRPDRQVAFDAAGILMLRGTIEGAKGSSVFISLAPGSSIGRFDPGDGGPRFLLSGRGGAGTELAPGELAVFPAMEAGGVSLDVPMCGVTPPQGFILPPSPPPPPPGPPGDRENDPIRGLRQIELAIDTDFELYQLFGNAQDTMTYIVQLYAQVSDIFIRDVGARVDLTYIRVWETPEVLYDGQDPLDAFRSHWQANMQSVNRDVAQLLLGSCTLSAGGVAYAPALCNGSSYSWSGYALGRFADPDYPSWECRDIMVTAHELGHNCGTFHTHDYNLDDCDNALTAPRRGSIMSYCGQTFSGGDANHDLWFHEYTAGKMREYMATAACIATDCNQNHKPDSEDIALGVSQDTNANGIPDECEDCNGNSLMDSVDIAAGTSADVNANGLPDECEPDCNDNGVPDRYDIQLGISQDLNFNRTPDECEPDLDGDTTADYFQIIANMTLDRDRDLRLDAYQDCDGDGINDLAELDHAWNLYVANTAGDASVREFLASSGVLMNVGSAGQIPDAQDLVITPSGKVLVSSGAQHRIAQFDRSGAYVRDLVPPGGGGMSYPTGMLLTPDGTLLVASRVSNSILEFSLLDGSLVRTVVAPGAGGLSQPFGLALSGSRLCVSTGNNRVLEYDLASGAFVRVLVPTGSGSLSDPRGLLFKPDGNLIVASRGTHSVLEYSGSTGAFIGKWNRNGTSNRLTLDEPWCLRLGPDGDVYVSRNRVTREGNGHDDDDGGDDDHAHDQTDHCFGCATDLHLTDARIYQFDAASGNYVRSYILGSDTGLYRPTGFDFMPSLGADCNRNHTPDSCDIASGTSADANANGIPDECEPDCPADIDGSGFVDTDDFDTFVRAFEAGVGDADFDGSGFVDTDDFDAFVLAFEAGC